MGKRWKRKCMNQRKIIYSFRTSINYVLWNHIGWFYYMESVLGYNKASTLISFHILLINLRYKFLRRINKIHKFWMASYNSIIVIFELETLTDVMLSIFFTPAIVNNKKAFHYTIIPILPLYKTMPAVTFPTSRSILYCSI